MDERDHGTYACETEWRCRTFGCGLVVTVRRPVCDSNGPTGPCPVCGTDRVLAWPTEPDAHRTFVPTPTPGLDLGTGQL